VKARIHPDFDDLAICDRCHDDCMGWPEGKVRGRCDQCGRWLTFSLRQWVQEVTASVRAIIMRLAKAVCYRHNARGGARGITRLGEWHCPSAKGGYAFDSPIGVWHRWGIALWPKQGEQRYEDEEDYCSENGGHWVRFRVPRIERTCPLCYHDIDRRGAKHHWRLRPILSKRRYLAAWNERNPF
jgi:hypothetical protein